MKPLVLVLAAALLAPGHGDFPRVGMYSAMRGNGWPLLRADGSIDSAACREQAKFDHVILDAPPPKLRPEILRTLRHYNPRIKLYAYVMGAIYWRNPRPALGDTTTDFPWRYWARVRDTDGILWCKGNRPCQWMNVNVAKPATMQALADLILTDVVWPGLWDGLFLDVSPARLYGITLSEQDTIDIARLGFASEMAFHAAWEASHRAFTARLRAGSPPGFPIMANWGEARELDLHNGWMIENFPFQNHGPQDDPWTGNMLYNQWRQPGYLVRDTACVRPTLNWIVSNPGYDSLSAETLRRHRYGLASVTLGNGAHSWCRCESEPRRRFWWFPEYAVNQYGKASTNGYWKGWLGAPLGPARRLASGVWRRDFKRGLVLVNPTNAFATVTPGGAFRRIRASLPGYDGRRDTAFTLPPRDGLFLLRAK
jgi:hypothetical protein